MDIQLIISRSILYFILIISVALSFTFITFTTGQFFEGKGQTFVTIVVSLIIVVFLDPLKRFLAKITDAFFYKAKIDYQEVLRQIGELISRELDLQKLSEAVEKNLQKQVKVSFAKLRLLTGSQNQPGWHNSPAITAQDENFVWEYVNAQKSIIVTDELSRQGSETKNDFQKVELEKLEKILNDMDCGLAMPVFSEERLVSILYIGHKLSGGPFTQEDINFFGVLGPQVSSALERSKLYEEVQEFNVKLQERVKQATLDLKERNRYLDSLQKLNKVVSRSFDFKKVMQLIADGINVELGFIGGILNFVNFKNKTVSVSAFTQNDIASKVLKIIPQDVYSYANSLDSKDNLGIRAINTEKIQVSASFWDFVNPALSHILSSAIQRIMGAKAIVAVPIFSENKVVGVIDYLLKKKPEEVTDVEKEMMWALSDLIGIVYRNLKYYEQIEQANQDLKDANIRLQQLDKAKSEFLSIASHQLRTPLTGIKGYLSMIVEGDYGEVPPQIFKVLNEVFLNSDRLTRLVNIFLNVSRIESGRFEMALKETDLIKLAEEVINELKPEADRKKLAINFKKPDKLIPFLMVDRDKIKDVMLNLLDNSIKYTPQGKIDISLAQDDGKIKVTFNDTGVGMLPDEVKDLFKKFSRGQGIAQIDTTGAGLGLYIAKKIVESHGGVIWAESKGKNLGATFSFTLPVK